MKPLHQLEQMAQERATREAPAACSAARRALQLAIAPAGASVELARSVEGIASVSEHKHD